MKQKIQAIIAKQQQWLVWRGVPWRGLDNNVRLLHVLQVNSWEVVVEFNACCCCYSHIFAFSTFDCRPKAKVEQWNVGCGKRNTMKVKLTNTTGGLPPARVQRRQDEVARGVLLLKQTLSIFINWFNCLNLSFILCIINKNNKFAVTVCHLFNFPHLRKVNNGTPVLVTIPVPENSITQLKHLQQTN